MGNLGSWNEDVGPPYNTRTRLHGFAFSESAPQSKAEDRDPPGGLQELRFSFGDAKATSQSDAGKSEPSAPARSLSHSLTLLRIPRTGTSA